MYSNCSSLSSITSYAAAHVHFGTTKRPITRRRGSRIWADDARPLGDTRQHHYRIEQGSDAAYYDVCLYQTVMARFHRPKEDSSYAIEYTSHSSNTSSQFMWRVLRISNKYLHLRDTQGAPVAVPLSDKYLGTRLTFTAAGLLDVARSSHQQVYTSVSTDFAKQWRKDVKAQLNIVLALFELRLPEIQATISRVHGRWAHPGKPFASLENENALLRNLRASGWSVCSELTEDMVGCLNLLYEAIAVHSVHTLDWRGSEAAIDPKNVVRRLLKYLETVERRAICPAFTQYKAYPKFSATLPNVYNF
jgi:hypothetical protein